MKTDELIALLARGAGPAPARLAARRLWPAAVLAFLLGAVAVWAGGAAVPAALMREPMWLLKLGYALSVALAAGWWSARLGRPGAPARPAARPVLAVVLAMAALGLLEQWGLPPGQRMAAWMGHSWTRCPVAIVVFALPALAGVLWALRGLAPTRPRLAGWAAGLCAGGVGASAYALCCTEVTTSFVATWYTLGIVGAGALGAALGPRLLRW